MLGFNRILLATDFSAGADAALQYAAVLARRSHATLQVLHVIDTRVAAFAHWTDIFRSTEVLAAKESQETEALQKCLAHPALTGLDVQPLMRHGHPADNIIDVTADVDLVVMGTQGTTIATGKAAGKVARQVAHGSLAPVLLVPAAYRSTELTATTAPSLPIQRILLAIHVVHYAPQAVTLSRAFAKVCNATLSVLQVLEPDKLRSYPLAAGAGLYHNLSGMQALLQQRLEEVVPDTPTGPAVERLVVIGTPSEVILQQANERRVDLVVMSVHAYGGVQKFFSPSTVDAVLEQTPCPLLAVPFPPAL
jgi:nucleotide-binding universal stress UspA family protein